MKATDVTIENHFGAIMARHTDSAGSVWRYWFDKTDAGRMALCAVVVEVTETSGRSYLDQSEWSVPDRVREVLSEWDFDVETIYDRDGYPIE